MTDQPATIVDRMTAAGISPERIAEHLDAGTVRVDGQPVTGPDHPAPTGTRWAIAGR